MRIEHIAIWTHDLERLRNFYETYFEGRSNAKYVNPRKQFESYFLAFAAGARLDEVPTRRTAAACARDIGAAGCHHDRTQRPGNDVDASRAGDRTLGSRNQSAGSHTCLRREDAARADLRRPRSRRDHPRARPPAEVV